MGIFSDSPIMRSASPFSDLILNGSDKTIPVMFGKLRSKFTRNVNMPAKRMRVLRKIGTERLIQGILSDGPYEFRFSETDNVDTGRLNPD